MLLSPHLDDAALSCAAVLAREEPIDVLTVFTGEPDPPTCTHWDNLCGFTGSGEAVRARKEEDRRAFADSPHRTDHLGLIEGQYLEHARPHADAVVLRDRVSSWVGEAQSGVILLPAGAGRTFGPVERLVGEPKGARRDRIKKLVGPRGRRLLAQVNARLLVKSEHAAPDSNPDHRWVRDVAMAAVAGNPAIAIVLYEEVPYLWGSPADDAVRGLARLAGSQAFPLVERIDRVRKADRTSCYLSQMNRLYAPMGRLDSPGGLPETERYWVLKS